MAIWIIIAAMIAGLLAVLVSPLGRRESARPPRAAFGQAVLLERLAGAVENNDFDALVAKVEAHLAANPNDVQGWMVIAPAYKRMQRYDDAAAAYANVLRLAKPTADLYADYAEMVAYANDGMVT